jgi:hypothetical protein
MFERFVKWLSKRKIIVQPDTKGRTCPQVPYNLNNAFLEQWENRGRLALKLGFLPQDSLKTITGYEEPSELLRYLITQPQTDYVRMLTDLAVSDQMLFGGAKRDRNVKLREGIKMTNQDAVNDDAIDRILNALPMTPERQKACEDAYIQELSLWDRTDGRWPKNPHEVRRNGELVDRFQFERDAEEAYQRLSKRAASAAFIEAYTQELQETAA